VRYTWSGATRQGLLNLSRHLGCPGQEGDIMGHPRSVDTEAATPLRRSDRNHHSLELTPPQRNPLQRAPVGENPALLRTGLSGLVHCLRQQQNLRSVVTRDVRHASFYRVKRRAGSRSAHFSHGLLEFCNNDWPKPLNCHDLCRRRSLVGVALGFLRWCPLRPERQTSKSEVRVLPNQALPG
jgi:hypothetical protein